ncbi:FHA domain-containing protein [Halalkalibacterium halodurans]|uniref:FHA domain-containing protein n=1 Tax=Halalkalibacterium halodurans TaxID=86665 RepID=UPI001067D0E3|nr:FHA domain-containing protein [Halalkalibacterium halodurans]TES54573.1 FHA domain-containing protein [Halalkalibacterium halodurans]
MRSNPFLIVERGVPYEPATVFTVKKESWSIGRLGKSWKPDIAFDNVFISRKHALLYVEEGQVFVKDLDSKHGTYVNDQRLAPHAPERLSHGDRLSLAKDIVVLTFSAIDMEETFDLTPFLPVNEKKSKEPYPDHVKLDPVKQTLLVSGEDYHFSEKEYKCIELLVQRYGEFVSKETLLPYVWPERKRTDGEGVDVSAEEVNSLLYRVRKKVAQSIEIETIRGKGYILTTK